MGEEATVVLVVFLSLRREGVGNLLVRNQ